MPEPLRVFEGLIPATKTYQGFDGDHVTFLFQKAAGEKAAVGIRQSKGQAGIARQCRVRTSQQPQLIGTDRPGNSSAVHLRVAPPFQAVPVWWLSLPARRAIGKAPVGRAGRVRRRLNRRGLDGRPRFRRCHQDGIVGDRRRSRLGRGSG